LALTVAWCGAAYGADPVITEGDGPLPVSMNEDGSPTSINLTLNATDADASQENFLEWIISNNGINGAAATTAGLGKSNVISYDPFDEHFNGSDTFFVQVKDPDMNTDEIRVDVTVNPQPDVPEITEAPGPELVNMDEDGSPDDFSLTLNATDPDEADSNMGWSISTGASNGTATVDTVKAASKSISYAPNADFNVSDSFVVRVTDSSSLTADIQVSVTVDSQPDDPEITEGPGPQAVVMDEDGSPTAFNLTLNATDGDELASGLGWSITDDPNNGFATVGSGSGASQAISYTPNADFHGSDSFEVTVTDSTFSTDEITVNVTVRPINDQPTLDNGGTLTLTELAEDPNPNNGDTVATILASDSGTPISDNDTGDSDGIAITAAVGTSGTWQYFLAGGSIWTDFPAVAGNSALLLDENDFVRFQPTLNFSGTIDPGITFQAWDQSTGTRGGTGDATDNGDADDPFSAATEMASVTVSGVNDPPVAPDIADNVDEDDVLTIGLSAYISDPDTDLSAPWTALPAEDNVRVTVTQGAHGSVNVDVINGDIIYTPFADEYGSDSFVYRVTDGDLFDTGEVSVTIDPVNDPPFAQIDSESMTSGQTQVTVDVLDNDGDLDGNLDPATVAIVTGKEPANGTTSVNPANGEITYTLNPGLPSDFAGEDTFTYEVFDDDASPLFATATVTIFISPLSFTVDSLSDEADGDISANNLSLREAVRFIADGGVISFKADLFASSAQTIILDDDPDDFGPLILDKGMTIVGPGADLLTISGNGLIRTLSATSGAASVTNLTIADGYVEDESGAGVHVATGADLTLLGVHVTGNTVAGDDDSGTTRHGGGIFNEGTLTLINSTLSGNSAGVSGGGVYSTGSLTVTNGTFSGNTALEGDGGGLLINGGTAAVTNTTVTANTALNGGGLSSVVSGVASINNSILAGNTASGAPDVQGVMTSNGHNVIGDVEGSGDSFLADQSGAHVTTLIDTTLQVNGGAIPTHSLLADSVAIDAGQTAAVPVGITTDARGAAFIRTHGAAVDVGAYEVTTHTVDTAADADDVGDDRIDLSPASLALREAVAKTYPGDTIIFDPVLAGSTLTLNPAFEEISIDSNLGIRGLGADMLTLSGGGATQIIYIPAVDADVVISGLTFSNALDTERGGGAIYSFGSVRMANCTFTGNAVTGFDGGAIHNRGTMVLSGVTLSTNTADNLGGAIINWGGALSLDLCVVTGNTAQQLGGAIYNLLGGVVSVTDTTIGGNSAGSNGGGVYSASDSTLVVKRSTFSANTAASDAGAIASLGVLTISNSTISGNTAGRSGGGIHLGDGTALLTNATITDNTADVIGNGFGDGGGIHREGGTLSLHNTIVAGNLDTLNNEGTGNIRPDVSGTVTSLGSNLIGNANGAEGVEDGVNGDQAGTGLSPIDPLLGALADNGGPTFIHRLLVQSPAIDAGDDAAVIEGVFDGPTFTDQRGTVFDRSIDGIGDEIATVDIGAMEFLSQSPVFATTEVINATEDVLYQYAITVTDPDVGEILVFSAPDLADWLSLVDNGDGTATLSGTPTNADIGSPYDSLMVDVTLIVEDWAQVSAEQEFVLTVTGTNDTPLPGADTVETDEDVPVTIDVLENDVDDDGALVPGSVTVVSAPSNGSTTVNVADGEITYTPNAHFNGQDSFIYQVSDDGTPLPAKSAQATVTITVLAVNDRPVVLADPVAMNEDSVAVFSVIANDTDIDGNLDPTMLFIPIPPANGTVDVHPVTGDITYTPNPDFNGVDTFNYRIFDDGFPAPPDASDGVVTVVVAPVNDPPLLQDDLAATDEDTPVSIDVLLNDFDIDGNMDSTAVAVTSGPNNGSVSVDATTGVVTYTPEEDFVGDDSFVYRAFDDGEPLPALSSTAMVTISVAAINDAPDLRDDSATTVKGFGVSINVLGNDVDPDGGLDLESLAIITPPSDGSATVLADGIILYEPAEDFVGSDSFEYEMADLGSPLPALTSTATVTVNVLRLIGTPRAFFVDSSAAESGDGSSAHPFNVLSDAINATVDLRGDVINLLPGTYAGPATLKASTKLLGQRGAYRTTLTVASPLRPVLTLADGSVVRGVTVIGRSTAMVLPADASAQITNCVLTGADIGLSVGARSEISFINNTVYESADSGLRIEAEASVSSLRNNIFVDNGTAVTADSPLEVLGGHNALFGNGVDYVGFSAFSSDLGEDPLFVDASNVNFHLTAQSPARDAGDPDPAFTDRDGSPNDIGVDGGPLGALDATAPAPHILISPDPAVGDSPFTVFLDGSDATDEWGIASYSWDFDAFDGLQEDAAGVTAEATYLSDGTYRVTLTVVDGNGLVNRGETEIVVGTPPDVQAIATPASGAAPLTVQFTTTAFDPDGGPLTYSWDFEGSGEEGSTDPNPQYTYPAGTVPGLYPAIVTVVDDEGAITQRIAPVTITSAEPIAAAQIDPDLGGTIVVDDPDSPLFESMIEIPPGALTEPTVITIAEVADVPPGNMLIVVAVDLGPSGTEFAELVTVTIALPPDADPDLQYEVRYYDPVDDEWKTDGIFVVRVVPLGRGFGVQFETTHFTIFAVGFSVAGDLNLDGRVDAIDVQLVTNAVLGLPIPFDTGDANRDSVINALDIQFVVNAALGV
jgi:PKD repeat protein